MAVFYYTGGVGGAWSTSGAWSKLNTTGAAPYLTNTTGNPGPSDVAVLNVNSISIPSSATGTSLSPTIDVGSIYGALQLSGTVVTTTTALNGSLTSFTTELAIGVIVRTAAGTSLGTVTQVISDTSAVVSGGATNASPIFAYAGGGASATATLSVTTSSSYYIRTTTGGIEGGQLQVAAPTVFIVTGTGNASTNVTFACAGSLRGAGISGGANCGIKATLTNSIVSIGCTNVYGGITASDNYGFQNTGAGNNITITATGDVVGVTATAINQGAVTGQLSVAATGAIRGGSSCTGILFNTSNTSGDQTISAATIAASVTCPAIMSTNASNVGGLNPVSLVISAGTSINTSGTSGSAYAAIQASRYKLTTPTIYMYNSVGTQVTYSIPTSGDVYPVPANVLWSQGVYGPGGSGNTPTLQLPTVGNVLTTQGVYGVGGSGSTPTYVPVAVSNVRKDINYGAASALQGTCYVPAQGVVLTGNLVDTADTGQLTLPSAATVFSGVTYGSYSSTQGTLDIWSQSVTPYNDPTKFGGLINQLNTNLTSAQQVLGNVQSVSLSTQGTVLSIQSTGEINQTNILGAQSVLTTTNSNVISAQTVLTDVNTNVNSVQQVTGNIQQVTLSTQAVVDSIQAVTGTPQDIANQVWSDFDTNPNNSPYIQRVHNVSTVDTTGQQISTI
jgi:hypothetical protein